MVRNTFGGNKSKGFARKNFTKKDNGLRISEDSDEIYAQVVKLLGGSACHVIDINNKKMLCHIRGKFRGRGKRDNFISCGSWLLVGLRNWEKDSNDSNKLLNCDIIEVYNESDKLRLKNNIININWSLFINNHMNSNSNLNKENLENDGLIFVDEKTQEYQDLIESQLLVINSERENLNSIIEEEEINVDEI